MNTLTHGQYMNGTVEGFRARLFVMFEENEGALAADTALRSLLLDADRLAWEYLTSVQSNNKYIAELEKRLGIG